ncbi:MAG: hypothetical protein IT380_12000 [Myxococcales bacterium]|nr:hypothetical protein [Myxococcales bacterium]
MVGQRVEQFFTSLSKRQTMLLLTSLAFGSSEALEAYGHLAIEEEELLRHRAKALLQIPRDKRVSLLVQEIKRLVTQRRRQLASVDPKRLATVLKKERGALTEVVLSALPSDLADAARAELGGKQHLKLKHEVKPDILSIVRWKLEEAVKQGAPQVGTFRFTDLLTLQQRELLAVCDRMGARVLATAVAGLPDEARTEWLGKLPPDQRALAVRAAEAGASRRLTEKDAKLVLDMHGAIENPSQGLRSAGAQRIARACVAQSPEFAQRMIERHQNELGRLLQRWVREERGKPIRGDGGRLDIVEQLERLAQKGIVDRPVRLPPPIKPPPGKPAAPRLPGGATPSQSKVLVPPPARRPTGNVAAPRQPTAGARRDPIAEREARKAGVGRSAGAVPGYPGPPRETNSQGKAQQRIMRDGKLLDTLPPKRRPTSPVQALPRRKEPAPSGGETGSHRSPVVKGSRRGPGGGSE